MSKLRFTVPAAAILAAGAAPAATSTDYTALREDAYIHVRLLIAAKAWLIAENCPTLKPRKIAAIPHILKMQSRGRSLGYTSKEMSAYVDSKEEQERFRQIAEPWLEEQGAVPDEPDSYCAVGRAEMAERTYVGKLLREK